MADNLLVNAGFEAEWKEKHGHDCLVVTPDGNTYTTKRGSVFTPHGWAVWYKHEEGVWAEPEVRDAWKKHDPRRTRSGEKGILLFTFGRLHDGGFYQRVSVEPGTALRASAYAHAWSNHKDEPGKFPHPDNPKWSEGAGYSAGYMQEGTAPNDEWRNFTFYVGIDPTGGTNPFAPTVVWGIGMHIYNEFSLVLPVETVAQADVVTVFLRSRAIWPFKHNDAYWDDAVLEAVYETPVLPLPHRGEPRVQYQRTYVLLPPDAGAEWAKAIVDATWDRHRYTVGGSADDAGIGDLDVREIIAINPDAWPGDLREFFDEHYPGVEVVMLSADTPEQLPRKWYRDE